MSHKIFMPGCMAKVSHNETKNTKNTKNDIKIEELPWRATVSNRGTPYQQLYSNTIGLKTW